MTHLALRFLGNFQATLDNQPLTGIESDKVRALLIYLVIESAEPHSREELIGLLWPDRPEVAARATLRQAIANLRQVLGDREVNPPFLIISGDTLQFNRDSDYWLDVTAFHELVQACAEHPHRQPHTCRGCAARQQTAIELYRGDFLAQFRHNSAAFEEWALLKREQLHHVALDVLYGLAEYHARRNDYERVRHYALRQIELDPWREEAHRQLMIALALSGQRSTALAQYEKCRRILANELEVEPATATRDLFDQIRRDQLCVPSGDVSLPQPSAIFIGRDREMAEIDRLIAESACRIVSLVGAGGVGKTALAVRAARQQIGAFADGVHYISLVALDEPERLTTTMVQALNVSLEPNRDPADQLIDYLARREMLLVLDNFEQLGSVGAEQLAALSACTPPSIVFLVTSRERLNLRDEWVIEVQGLSVPPTESEHDIADYCAVQMFVRHLERIRGARALSADEWQHVAQICRLTAGLPLAIELAATRTRHRSLGDIEREIARSLDFVSAPLNDLPKRHRSLRAVFDQSWQLLSPVEREVMRALAVFRGSFTLEEAEGVVAVTSQQLSALVDKSLVRATANGRYVLHEMIQPYAEEQLRASRNAQSIYERHRAYYRDRIGLASPPLFGISQV